jgi:hypothetical protein
MVGHFEIIESGQVNQWSGIFEIVKSGQPNQRSVLWYFEEKKSIGGGPLSVHRFQELS